MVPAHCGDSSQELSSLTESITTIEVNKHEY